MPQKIDFIGIGAAKSGTTTVARLLEAHPEICLSIPKELMYFNALNPQRFKERQNPYHLKSMDWYFKHFEHCSPDSIKGEFSPDYFQAPHAPKNIHHSFPNIKLIVCLRNPVDRAYSHYQMVKNYHLAEKRTFSQAIREASDYVEEGLYFKHLSRYLDYFELQNILVLTFEEIRDAPQKLIQKLYQFLGVHADFLPENIDLKANAATQTRFGVLKDLEFFLIKTLPALGLGGLIKRLKSIQWLHKFYTKPYQYPPMKEEDKRWLQELFLADIEHLENLLQRDFSHWK